MAPKAIRPETESVSCAVCGRRLLQGEHPEIYLAGGARRTVCELCTMRAAHQGWIRESAGLQLGHRASEARRPLLGRLRSRRRVGNGGPPPRRDADAPAAADTSVGRAAAPAEPLPDDGVREPRHVHAVPTSGELKTARALEVFNSSEHPRTIAGVARSLGVPAVAVHPSAEHGSTVSIVVAWELCWYRYEVDLADEGSNGVRVAGQGYELTELAPEDQVANAAADEHGSLVLSGHGGAEG